MADLATQFLQLDAPQSTNQGGGDDLAMRFLQIGAQLGDTSQVNRIPEMRPPPQGIERFARQGVPLDVTTGVQGFGKRAGLSFAPNDEDYKDRVRRAYAGSTVDDADGNLIIRNVLDQATGQTKDLLVDERDITMGDLGDMASAGLQMIAEAFALKGLGQFTKGMGRLGRLGTEAAAGSAVAQTTGGATDIANRLINDQPIMIREIAGRRLGEGIQGAALGAGMGGVVEGIGGTTDALTGKTTAALGPGELERSGIEAVQRLNQGLSPEERILPTMGQIASNPDVMRFEAVMSKMPLIGRLFRAPMAQQEEAIRGIQRKAIGEEPLTPLADIGLEAAQTIQSAARRSTDEAVAAETSLISRATDELDTALTRLSPQVRPFTAGGASSLTKLSARTQFKSFQDKADELFEAAGDPIIRTDSIKPELERIRGDLPKKTTITESELVDQAGKPLATVEGKEIIRELVPEKLSRLMRGLDQLDPQMPLSELRRIRGVIDSAIVDGRGLPEISTYELKQLQGAITKTIDNGVKALGDSTVAKKLGRANTFYREGIDRFEVPLISRLLKKDPNQPGFIRPNEMLDLIQKDPDSYQELERFMRGSVVESGQAVGPSGSRQFDVLRRSMVEEMFSRARLQPGSTTSIDADRVIAELGSLKPAVRASLLGGEAKTITRNLELLSQLKKGYKNVPEDQLRNFLNRPNNSVEDLSKLAKAKHDEETFFENTLLKKFLKGDTSTESLPTDQTINWLLTSKNTSEVADFMAKIGDNPQLSDKIRRQFLFGFLQKNRTPLKSGDAARLDDVSEILSPGRLAEAMKDQTTRKNLQTILGNDSFNFVKNFTEAQSIIGKQADSTAASAGGMAATSAILDIFKMFRHPTSAAKYILFSIFMTNRGIREAIMEQSLRKPVSTAEFTRALISSTPVVEALAEDLGTTGAQMLLQGFQSEE